MRADNATGFKGVYRDKGKCEALAKEGGKRVHLGNFSRCTSSQGGKASKVLKQAKGGAAERNGGVRSASVRCAH